MLVSGCVKPFDREPTELIGQTPNRGQALPVRSIVEELGERLSLIGTSEA